MAKSEKKPEETTPPAPETREETTEETTADQPQKVEAITVVEPIEPVQVPQDFTPKKITRNQIEIIKTQIAKGASDDELKMFLYVCERTGLDPFTRQVHLVPRWDGKLGKEVRTVIVGIDGLRSIAERTGAYAGNSDPEFGDEKEIEYTDIIYEGKTKKEVKKKMFVPTKASVTVSKIVQGVIVPFPATAKWDEYYPGDKGGIMWRKMPNNMLGKCAEAKALRKAFPSVMSGLYVAEEMHQAGVGVQTDAQKAAAQQIALFTKAKKNLEAQNDKAKLEDYRSKIEESDKYTEPQKVELLGIIDKKLESEAK